MKKWLYLILILPVLVIGSCDKIATKDVPIDLIEVGKTDGSIYFSNLTSPDTIKAGPEEEVFRKIDLDGDTYPEITINASYFTEGNIQTRQIKLEKIPAYVPTISIIIETPSAPYHIKPFNDGFLVQYSREYRLDLASDLVLAKEEKNLESGLSLLAGNWIGIEEKSFIIFYASAGTSSLSWIKISVPDYDTFVFHNCASFK